MHLSNFSLSPWGSAFTILSERAVNYIPVYTHSVSQKVKVVVHIAVDTCPVILQKCTALHPAFRSKEKQFR